uniref:Akirin n=1 Tax=Hemiselmis tepida TaxID=464990 RepID=A0A7S0V0D5_9CRYP|mmetsp:Transcript_1045/g.2632  ORF Transcript_1045/g.2632 Transcript_1045/m.2632 type:complete len:182 (+) Transcript_1045:103-648(+)
MATVAGVQRTKRALDLDGLNDALPTACASGVPAHGSATHVGGDPHQLQAAKRQRVVDLMAQAAQSAGVPVGQREQNFPKAPPMREEELEEIVASLAPRESPSKRPVLQEVGGHSNREARYTLEEVKSIVNNAVSLREAAVREEYERILSQKLCDQFQTFTRHNQDYVSRLMKGASSFSYVS